MTPLLLLVAVGIIGAVAILLTDSPWTVFAGLALGVTVAWFAIFIIGCGPTWDQVRVHDNGVIEDPAASECWTMDLVPVRCPDGRIMAPKLRAVGLKGQH